MVLLVTMLKNLIERKCTEIKMEMATRTLEFSAKMYNLC